MTSPLEYLLLMMLSTQPDASHAGVLSRVEPASGNPVDRESFLIQEDGRITMRTILMEPQNLMTERFEAPVKIPPEWLPSFKVGTPLDVHVDATGKTYEARIIRIESITDETGSSVQVITALKNRPAELEPGMVATATIKSVP